MVAETDPVGEHGWLTRIDVDAAQILDVALVADGNHVVVGAQHRAVPDIRASPDRHRADYHRAWRYPGLLMYGRCRLVERADKRGAPSRQPPRIRPNTHGPIIADCPA